MEFAPSTQNEKPAPVKWKVSTCIWTDGGSGTRLHVSTVWHHRHLAGRSLRTIDVRLQLRSVDDFQLLTKRSNTAFLLLRFYINTLPTPLRLRTYLNLLTA